MHKFCRLSVDVLSFFYRVSGGRGGRMDYLDLQVLGEQQDLR